MIRVPGGRFVAAAALMVLLGTPLLPVAQVDAAAWRLDHGHASLGGAVGEHTHPWDEGHGHTHGDSLATDPAGASDPSVVFTMDDDGSHAAEARGVPLLTALMAPPAVVVRVAWSMTAGVAPGPEAPPPRGT